MSKSDRCKIFCLAAALLLLCGSGPGQERDERRQLLVRQKDLTRKVEKLRSEQAFLLFEKAMFTGDSKYLVLHAAGKRGQLKYRNRILKDFRFTGPRSGRLGGGMAAVTKKIEGPNERNALLFGRSFVMTGPRPPAGPFDPPAPRLFLSKKNFLSVYYAVEKGALAYVLP